MRLPALFLCIATAAIAQEQTQQAPPAQAAQPAPQAPEEAVAPRKAAQEEIVVTGTRVRRKDLNTPAPVTVLSRDQITAAGRVSIGEFLQSLPEQGNSGANAQVNNGNDGSIFVSLRSLGAQRTLVLVNGRRMVPGGTAPGAAADLGTIPAAAIERVEILKDGASAIYGSDAIGGVVNVILRKRYNGTEVGGYAGVSQHGDGQTYDAHALTGVAGDRSSLLVSLGYQEQRPVFAGDRDWSKTTYTWNWTGTPGVTDPNSDAVNTGTGCYADPNTGLCVAKSQSGSGNSSTFPNGRFSIPASACGTVNTNPDSDFFRVTCQNPKAGCAYTPSAAVGSHPALAAACSGITGTSGAYMANSSRDGVSPGPAADYIPYPNDAFNTNPTNYLITPARRIQIFSTGDVNLGNAARAFYEASYVNRHTQQTLAPMPLVNSTIPTQPVTVSRDSMYNPFGVNVTSWRIRTVEFGARFFTQDLDTFRIVVGLDGSLGDWSGPLNGWSWNVDYNHGRTGGNQLLTGQLRMPNIANAVGPSDINPTTNQPVCLKVKTGDKTKDFAASNIIAGCVPFDVLHGSYSGQSAAKSYVSYDGTDQAHNQQDIWQANVSGDLFKLASERPAGLAIGADYRRESAGFQNNPINSGESSGNNAESTSGGYNVKEVYGELVLPLIGGMTGIEDLELQAAGRYVDYSTFGTNSTYKLGARYSPIRDVTMRATYGTAFRAPNVGELFGGAADNYPTVSDPCRAPTNAQTRANCQAHGVPGGASGDPSTQLLEKITADKNLGPETATTFTAGIVIQPRMVRNLSLTFDYYNLNIKDTITTYGAGFILSNCYVTGNIPSLCNNVIRDANGIVIQINDPRANLGSVHTTGIDFALRYALPVADFGRFSMVLDGSYLHSFRLTDSTGVVTDSTGNFDLGVFPRLKANAGLFWTMGGLGAGASMRYIGAYKECFAGGDGLCSEDDSNQRRISPYTPVDIFLSYTLRDWSAGTTGVVLGMNNLFNVEPPFISTAAAANSDPSTYDYIGRFMYARVTHTF